MAITIPYGVELGAHEDAKDAVEGDGSTIVAGKMTLALTATVPPARAQAIICSRKNVFRHMMNESLKKRVAGADLYGFANWADASSGNVTVGGTTTGLADGDVIIALSSTFPAGTHFYKETFDQLINVLRENLTEN